MNKPIDIENVLDTLIRRCTSLPEKMRPGSLYAGDRLFLMMYIRAASYGKDYAFKASCPACRSRWDHKLDILEDLEVKEVGPNHEDPFKVELPVSGDIVTLKIFRGDDERAVIQFVEKQNKKVDVRQIGDPGYTFRLALHTVGVDSRSDPQSSFDEESCSNKPGALIALASRYIEKLTAQDSSTIREEIDERTPGILLRVDMECPRCGNEFTLAVPLEPSFFRSGTSSGSRSSAGTVSRPVRSSHVD